MNPYFLAVVFCLAITSCSSSDTNDASEAETSSTSTTAAPTTTSTTATTEAPTTEDSTTAEEPEDSNEDGDATGSTVAELPTADEVLSSYAASLGINYDDELKTCLAGRGIDVDGPELDLLGADLGASFVALVGCAPAEAAETMASDVEVPEGLTEEDFACVATELFTYIGSLSPEESQAAFETNQDDELKELIGPAAQEKCGLTEEQVNSVIDT